MEWSEKETFQFLELFQKEPIIWDPKNKLHKNNQKLNDAWVRLSEEMCRLVPELKNKKNSLMATFRQHLRRKKQSLQSGAGEDDAYKPVWLYYDAMETFLASVYKCHTTINTEEGLHEGLYSVPLLIGHCITTCLPSMQPTQCGYHQFYPMSTMKHTMITSKITSLPMTNMMNRIARNRNQRTIKKPLNHLSQKSVPVKIAKQIFTSI
ncbi:unnamed protein product [Acanthoscelides obtectus]|uniref:MADF domain-containing protein n=1 Tax=Acanthoscelides obtectus TaxID=200917 RepID=A0A9P0LFC9_ACAOB|nr:unnamed protein product [Acanthoscelides obtectus]CAK1649822.1 hypothetical protein AOBTE_LOCUS16448 [Acanthoscelides obtectus]